MFRTLLVVGLLMTVGVALVPGAQAETGCAGWDCDPPWGDFWVSPSNCVDYAQNIVDNVQCTIDEQQGQPCE